MDKKKICTITILLHTIQLFASDMTSRGRISSGHNDFTGFIIGYWIRRNFCLFLYIRWYKKWN